MEYMINKLFKLICHAALVIATTSVLSGPISLIDTQVYAAGDGFELNPAKAVVPLVSKSEQQHLSRQYLRLFFEPWDAKFVYKNEKKRADNFKNRQQGFLHTTLYGMNFKAYPGSFITRIFQTWTRATKASHAAAIVIRATNVRALPTQLPLFYDYTKAGNGYPFDMNQSQKLWIGVPVAVVLYTQDRRWAFVMNSGELGWVDARDIATVSKKFIAAYKHHHFAAIIKDNVPLTYQQHFLLDTRIGQIFPLQKAKLVIPVAGLLQSARTVLIAAPSVSYARFPFSLTPQHMMQLIRQMLGEPYDWGAQYNYRDCSLTMMSLFAPFGLYLPRGSDQQKAMGRYINLKSYSNNKKKMLLNQYAKPFLTLIGLEGHVMLYLGRYQNQDYVFQDKWGLTTQQDGHTGRAIIGKEVITPLSIGMHVTHVDQPLWSSVESMTLLKD
jgi:hypothetical protein